MPRRNQNRTAPIVSVLLGLIWMGAAVPSVGAENAEPRDWVELIKAVETQPEAERSLRLAEQYIQKYPSGRFSTVAAYVRAEILFQQSRFTEAAVQYQRLAESGPPLAFSDSAWFRWGECLYNLGQFTQALDIWAGLERRFPDSHLRAEVMARRALLLTAKDTKQAMSAYQALFARFPHYRLAWDVRIGLARLAFLEKDYGLCKRHVGELSTPEALYLQLQCMLALQEDSQLVQMVCQQLQAQPTGEMVALLDDVVQELFKHKRYTVLELLLDRALNLLPVQTSLHQRLRFMRGHVLYQQGRFEAAATTYRQGLAQNPKPAERWYGLYLTGLALYQLPERESALREWDELGAQLPRDEMGRIIRLKIANAFMRAEDYVRARSSYEKLVQLHPQTAEAITAQRRLAQVYYQQGRDIEAVQAYQEYLRSSSEIQNLPDVDETMQSASAPPPPPPPPPQEDKPEPEDFTVPIPLRDPVWAEKIRLYAQGLGLSASHKTASPWLTMITKPPILDVVTQTPRQAISEWKFIIESPDHEVLFMQVGGRELPKHIVWNGRNTAGRMIRVGEEFMYSIVLQDQSGQALPQGPPRSHSLRSLTYSEPSRCHIQHLGSALFLANPNTEFSDTGLSLLKESSYLIIQHIGRSNRIEVYSLDPELGKKRAKKIQEYISQRLSIDLDEFKINSADTQIPNNEDYYYIICEQ